MAVRALHSGVLAVAIAGALLVPNAIAAASPASSKSISPSTGRYAWVRGGPYTSQASCEASRPASTPPSYYSYPCRSYPSAPYPPAGGPGWYWTAQYDIT